MKNKIVEKILKKNVINITNKFKVASMLTHTLTVYSTFNDTNYINFISLTNMRVGRTDQHVDSVLCYINGKDLFKSFGVCKAGVVELAYTPV